MGLHAYLLEHGWRTAELLSRYHLLGQPCAFGLSLESNCPWSTLRLLPICLLDMGYCQRPKEPVQATGTRYAHQKEDFSSDAMDHAGESQKYPHKDWRLFAGRWVVRVCAENPLYV